MQFVKNQPFIDISFWKDLGRLKLDILKLDTKSFLIHGVYRINKYEDENMHPQLHFDIKSLNADQTNMVQNIMGPIQIFLMTKIIVLNTIESYSGFDFKGELQKEADEIFTNFSKIISEHNIIDISQFFLNYPASLMVVFPDLKCHTYHYKFSNIELATKDLVIKQNEVVNDPQFGDLIKKHYDETKCVCPVFFIYDNTTISTTLSKDLIEKSLKSNTFIVGIIDSYNQTNGISSLIQTIVAFMSHYFSSHNLQAFATSVPFILIKDSVYIGVESKIQFKKSIKLVFDMSKSAVRKNENQSILLPSIKILEKTYSLGKFMDARAHASEAVDLNIRLMKWRLAPELDLAQIQNSKCLLFGAGTLGCQIARNLLGWGVRQIDFIDNGIVRYSNPVRQSLYTFEDSAQEKLKAPTAAECMKKIFPDVKSTGYSLKIPMPGHFVTEEKEFEKVMETVEIFDKLIQNSDVVYLVTDSRESRWLPTLLCALRNKLCISVALGFDNYIIIRHGHSPVVHEEEKIEKDRVGCYFCNDYLAPSNSTIDRSLDQQCTVTRPGLSYISSAFASELFVNILHHANKNALWGSEEVKLNPKSIMGLIPQHIRGSAGDFEIDLLYSRAFSHCIACSKYVVEAYEKNPKEFLFSVINNPTYLQVITEMDKSIELDSTEKIFILEDDENIEDENE